MKQIIVLMSSYNGEKYIREQIDSILKQVAVDVTLIVRDDGSKDKTLEILESYKQNNLLYYQGSNKGPAKSFMELLINAPEADYYAFADQDDVWDENKLITAVNSLSSLEEPALCIGSYKRVDNQLNTLDDKFVLQENYCLAKTIVYNAPLGCTMVFNHALKKVVLNELPTNFRMHDHWITMLVEAIDGKIIYNQESKILYRQHSNNVVGGNAGYIKRMERLIKSVLYNKNERQLQAKAMLEQYEEILSSEAKELLIKVRDYNLSIKNKMDLVLDERFKGLVINKKILFYMAVFIGVF